MADALFTPTELTALLEQLGEDVRQGYVDKLVKNGRPTTENTLASTVKAYVDVKGTTYEVGLELAATLSHPQLDHHQAGGPTT